MDKPCRFCEIIAGAEASTMVAPGIVSFPAIPASCKGHMLVAPVAHVTDALSDPEMTGRVFEAAARLAARTGGPCNLVTNIGKEAGQKVFHLHIHVLPRLAGGPLQMPKGRLVGEMSEREQRALALSAW